MNFSKRRQPAVGGAKNKSKQFSVALNIFYSTHRRLDWYPYSFGHPNVDFSAAPIILWRRMLPSATLNTFPAANAAYIRRLLLYHGSKRRLRRRLKFFPAAHVAFVGAIIPKRRRVNYKVNHGFSHLASLKKTRSGVKDAM